MTMRLATTAAFLLLAAGTGSAEVRVANGWARATLPNAPAAAGYATLTNAGSEPDRLVAVASARAAAAKIHTMSVENDVMTMRPLADGLPLAPGEAVMLAPGGLHLMFNGLDRPFKAGERVPVTFTFERAGEIAAELEVAPLGSDGPRAPSHGYGADHGSGRQ